MFEALHRRASQVHALDDLLAAGSEPTRIRNVLRVAIADPSMDLVLAVGGELSARWLRIEDDGVTCPDVRSPHDPAGAG